MAIDPATDLAAIIATGDAPALSGTYAQGSNTKTVAAYRPQSIRNAPGEGGPDMDETTFYAAATEFTSGFSVSDPVVPTQGDTYTLSGERAWTVRRVEPLAFGHLHAIHCDRQRQRGVA